MSFSLPSWEGDYLDCTKICGLDEAQLPKVEVVKFQINRSQHSLSFTLATPHCRLYCIQLWDCKIMKSVVKINGIYHWI